MPRRSRNWDALNEQATAEGVEYVGVVEDDAPAATVREPRPRIRRKPPRRAQGAQPAADTVLHMRPGSYISMNSDAARALHNAPMTEVGGQRVRRMQPGTYFVMADDDSAQVRAAMAGNEMGAIDVGGLIGQIGETATGLFTTGWGAYQQYEQQQAEADARREEARLARERAEAERQAAETAAERAHAQRMAEIAAETEALARQAEARAAAAREASIAPAAAPAAGMPGWAIALLAVGGMGAVGVIVYLLTRKKD